MRSRGITGGSVLRASVGAYRRHVGVAALFLVGHQTGEALVPVLVLVGVIIDQAVTTGDPRALAGSLPLGLLILLGTPPLLYVVHLLGKPSEKRSGPEQERTAQASGVAADLVSGVRVLKGIGAEPAAVRRYVGTSVTRVDQPVHLQCSTANVAGPES